SHAVETFVSTRRTALSECFSRESWRLLNGAFERLMAAPGDVDNAGAMLLGAHLAGLAIESSMLGAAHACANPLTARYGTVHGAAIGLLLEAVVRWNSAVCAARYRELHAELPSRLGDLAAAARLPRRLRDAAVPRDHLPALAGEAARQWTGQFNPRPFDEKGALEVYECVF
ncbi:MAG: iron-containing alcohol dehydrogenase, partial [Bryobacteraceae bacterium]